MLRLNSSEGRKAMNNRSLQPGNKIFWEEESGKKSFATFIPDTRIPDTRHPRRLTESNRMLVQQKGVELPRLIQEIQGSWFAYRGQGIFDLPIMKAPE